MPKKPVPHAKRGSYQTIWKRGMPPERADSRFLNGTQIRVDPSIRSKSWTRWAILCDIRKCPCRHYASKKAAKEHFPGAEPKRILITLID